MRAARRSISLLLFSVVSLSAAPALAGGIDPFAPRAALDADTVLYLDALSGNAGSVERLRARLDRSPGPVNAYAGRSFLCHFEFHAGQYAEAIPDCEKAIALDPKGGDANALTMARLVARLPPPRARGSARVAVTKGARVLVQAGGYDGAAIADTGAQISVMMRSVATAAHVKMLGGSPKVDSPTAAVSGQIGLIPKVKIGDAALENVLVLVLPDAQLTVSDGKETISLPFILSLYALAKFGRVAWLDHDRWLALGEMVPASLPGATPMTWFPSGIAVPLEGPGGRRAAQFDSGADSSELYDNGAALLSDVERASIVKAKRTIGGLGAVVEQGVRRLPQANLKLAGQPLVLRNLDIANEPETNEAARLGEDILAAYSAIIFDFGAMKVSVSP